MSKRMLDIYEEGFLLFLKVYTLKTVIQRFVNSLRVSVKQEIMALGDTHNIYVGVDRYTCNHTQYPGVETECWYLTR